MNTGRLLQRKCACGQHTGGGECHACAGKGHLLQRHSVKRTGTLPSQVNAYDVLGALGHERVSDAALGPRPGGELRMSSVPGVEAQTESSGLRVGQPGDAYEREADHLAERVLASTGGDVAGPSLRTPSPSPVVQNHPSAEGAREATHEDAAPVQQVLRDGGQPLSPDVRDFFEPRFSPTFDSDPQARDREIEDLKTSL